jgi:hypothetical protein
MKTEKQFPELTDFQITETMRKKGGGFVSRLGVLFRHADENNQAKLKEAFAAYWYQYAAITQRCPECGRTDIMQLPEWFQCEDCNHQWGHA